MNSTAPTASAPLLCGLSFCGRVIRQGDGGFCSSRCWEYARRLSKLEQEWAAALPAPPAVPADHPILLTHGRGLTGRQRMAYDFIRECIRERGYPPTMREIGARMGIRSTNGVNDHLKALERKGYLRRETMTARGMRVVSDGPVDGSA